MIENLIGIHETVNYKGSTRLRLYVNTECETYPAHWHTAVEVLCPTVEGYRAVCNQTEYTLRTGDILFICPGVIHELPAQPAGERIIFQADCIALQALREMGTILSLMSPALLVTPENAPEVYPDLHRLLLEIRDEYLSGKPLSELAIYSYLLEMVVRLGRSLTWDTPRFDARTAKRQEYNEKMLAVCSFISAHCTENPSLEQAAAQIGFSKYHFDRLFKKFSGVSYYKYLNAKRISYATELLLDPDVSVTEVAMKAGFSSLTAFSRMFKLVKNCTPSEFRGYSAGKEETLG